MLSLNFGGWGLFLSAGARQHFKLILTAIVPASTNFIDLDLDFAAGTKIFLETCGLRKAPLYFTIKIRRPKYAP